MRMDTLLDNKALSSSAIRQSERSWNSMLKEIEHAGYLTRLMDCEREACPPFRLEEMSEAWRKGWDKADDELHTYT